MADNVFRRGFRWYRAAKGGKACPPPEEMVVATGYQGSINGGSNVDLNIGDPVRRLSTGYIEIADGNEGASGGEDVYGVIVGFRQYWDGSKIVPYPNSLPGGTAWGTIWERRSIALVVPADAGRWVCQADDTTTATTVETYFALLGENCDHRLTTGSEPDANPKLDISTHSATNGQWRLVDYVRGVDTDFSGANVELIVEVNEAATQLAGREALTGV